MKTQTMLASLVAILTAVALAQAAAAGQQKAATQEELPPPKAEQQPRAPEPAKSENRPLRRLLQGRQLPPDQRAAQREQRRERLLDFGGQLLDSLTGAPAAAGDASGGLEVGKVNGGLGALVKALVAGDARIESIDLAFDPAGTDFNKDMVKLTGKLALRQSAWSDQPSRASLALAGRIEQGGLVPASPTPASPTPPSLVPTRALLDGHVVVETQTLALVNYALVRYKQKLARDEQTRQQEAGADKPDSQDPDAKMQARLNEKLARVDQIRSLDELADLLVYIAGLQLTAANERIDLLQAQLDAAARNPAADAKSRDELAAKLTEARRERDRMLGVKPRIERSADGRATSVTLIVERAEPLVGAQVERMELAVTDRVIDISVLASLSRGLELYPLIKPVIVATLGRLQSGDGRAIEAVRVIVAEPFARVREFVVGEEVSPKEF